MNKQERQFTDYGVAFLDVISCGFGAIVLLVILVKEESPVINDERIETKTVSSSQQSISQKTKELENEIKNLESDFNQINQRLEDLKLNNNKNKKNTEFSREEKNYSSSVKSKKIRSPFLGGIPVDREYIIFIVDTSGSMKRYWSLVIQQIESILKIHPKIKGIQVMSDNGGYLLDGYASSWIPDTDLVRKRILKKLQNWSPYSNSSPSEGLERALRFHKNNFVSIYVLGDDFTGSSYDDVLNMAGKLNSVESNGKRRAKIHGIGFPWGVDRRFPTLMRELALQNDGVYLSVKLGKNNVP